MLKSASLSGPSAELLNFLFLATSLLSVLSLTTFMPIENLAFAQGNTNNDCSAALDQEMNAQNRAIDKDRAISLATSAPDFKTHVQGFSYTFNSIFSEGSSDPVTCSNYRIDTVTVVFMVNDPASGGFLKYVVVAEDPALTKVIDITEQQGAYYGPGSTNSINSVATTNTNNASQFEIGSIMPIIIIASCIAAGAFLAVLFLVKKANLQRQEIKE